MAIMTDHACRKWCTDPYSQQWHSAWLRWFRANNPTYKPLVGISSAHPRVPTMFQRVAK